MKIAIIGSGYVGLISAVGFAKLGHYVKCIDVDENKVRMINEKKPPIFEDGLQEALSELVPFHLNATKDFKAIEQCELVFICVGTPSKPNGAIDLTYIKKAAGEVGKILKNCNDFKTVVIKSTVSPTTTEKILLPLLEEKSGKKEGADFGLAMNPEFLREGTALSDFMHPDRIIIGSKNEKSLVVLDGVYLPLNSPILKTDTTTAEMIKYASNSFLATKISFINEIGNLCKKMGIDSGDVARGMGMDSRINPHFLNSGIGYGGSCFPKDVAELRHFAKSWGEEVKILDSATKVNELQPKKFISMLESKLGDLNGKKLAMLGLAFKANSDDIRESRTIPILKMLKEKGAKIFAFDPAAMENMKRLFPADESIVYCQSGEEAIGNSEIVLITTEWKEFARFDFQGKQIFEGKRVFDAQKRKELNVEGICW